MRTQSQRLMVELAIQRVLREITKGDSRRALRSVVEDACHLVRQGHPRRVFAAMKEMFRMEVHPYFELFSRAAQSLDHRFFTGFAVDLCYECWVRGTRTLRSEQRRLKRRLPWLMTFDLDNMSLTAVMEQMDAQLPLGAGACLLRITRLDAEALLALCSCYPRCAMIVLIPDEAMTDAALHTLRTADNLLLTACRRDGAFTSAPLLKAHRRLYALCRPLDRDALLQLMDSGDLTPPGDPDCLLPMFEPDADVPPVLRIAFYEWIEQRRQHPIQPLFPIDLTEDIAHIQSLISEDGA